MNMFRKLMLQLFGSAHVFKQENITQARLVEGEWQYFDSSTETWAFYFQVSIDRPRQGKREVTPAIGLVGVDLGMGARTEYCSKTKTYSVIPEAVWREKLEQKRRDAAANRRSEGGTLRSDMFARRSTSSGRSSGGARRRHDYRGNVLEQELIRSHSHYSYKDRSDYSDSHESSSSSSYDSGSSSSSSSSSCD
ncbi:hypothetical protein [Vibrio phage JSF12]|uniref:Uncharacterized protein n=2 Tax=Jesfedecavirus TaxID=2560156 RepID=A0A2D0YM03_9CAUD|nr:hypothetical protein FDI98_gp022 [Vibrio phage JSF10]YP_009794753.1 hypothetical protein HOS35_gp070 [Vibrio phage JSF12]ASV43510.1 hypothetical protein [Vibrio phage JSF10]ASV43588.1 hypothetical protein [Vibrio phage JSF12]